MKKLLSILLILAMISSLGVTAFAEDRREITSAEFPFYLMGDDSGEKVTLYFLDGVNDLPYVELNDWMDLLNMIIGDEDDENGYRLSLETAGPVACYTRENGFTMVIDFDENIFRFLDYNFFMKLPNMSTLLDFTSKDCFNEAGEPALIKKSDSYSFDRYGDELVLRLGDYGIDLRIFSLMHLICLSYRFTAIVLFNILTYTVGSCYFILKYIIRLFFFRFLKNDLSFFFRFRIHIHH